MSAPLTIRPALPSDRQAILAVVREAFATGGRDGQEEIDIVESTWSLEAAAAGLELVAAEHVRHRPHGGAAPARRTEFGSIGAVHTSR